MLDSTQMGKYLTSFCGLALVVSSSISLGCASSGGAALGDGGAGGEGGTARGEQYFLIAYMASSDEHPDIGVYTSHANGSHHRKVSGTDQFTEQDSVHWHREGTSLSFIALPEGSAQPNLYLAAADGSELQQISGKPNGSQFAVLSDWSPDGSRILYLSYDSSTSAYETHVCTFDRLDCQQVSGDVDEGGGVWPVAWSPNGSRIAYVERKDGTSPQELFTCANDGSDRRKVSGELLEGTHVSRQNVAWSPDGSWLAYKAYQPMFGLYVSAPDGSNNRKVSNDLAWDISEFRWGPDGARIAFVEYRPGRVDLYTNVPDASDPVQVSASLFMGALVADFRWSPDGARIAYLGEDDNTDPAVLFELHSTRLDGTDDQIIKAGGSSFEMEWSPSGDRLAFLWRDVAPASLELYTSAPNGEDVRKVNGLFGESGEVSSFKWSPDSSSLAYYALANPAAASGLSVAGTDGSNDTMVGRRWEVLVPFDWSPDGSRIAYVVGTESSDSLNSPALFTNLADGSDEQRVSESLGPDGIIWNFAWSPAPVSP